MPKPQLKLKTILKRKRMPFKKDPSKWKEKRKKFLKDEKEKEDRVQRKLI